MSRLWYKPKITRDEGTCVPEYDYRHLFTLILIVQSNRVFVCTAIALLKDKPAGAFIIRDSNTFEGSFGLAVKVSQLPPNVQAKGSECNSTDPFAVHCVCATVFQCN